MDWASASEIATAVIGSGFIGTVHIEALRRIGVRVAGLLDAFDAALAQRQDVLEHGALLGREPMQAGASLQHILQVGADRSRFPSEERPQDPRKEALPAAARNIARPRNRHGQVAHLARLRSRISRTLRVGIGHGASGSVLDCQDSPARDS